MKKQIFITLVASALCFQDLAPRDGGAAVAGALGGLAIGTMIGSASSRDSRTERRAERAEDIAEQNRIDAERQRVTQLEREMERRELERKIAENSSFGGNLSLILFALVIVLLFAVIGLGIVVLRKKP